MLENTTPIEIQLIDNSAPDIVKAAEAEVFGLPMENFLITILCSLVIGLIIAATYRFRNRCSRGFIATLIMIPTAVSAIIAIVSHDIGTGLAMAGAFSLVRFRSLPGSAKELGMLFLAMGAGLTVGMGQPVYGLLFTLILCLVFLIVNNVTLSRKRLNIHRTINVTIPEDLDYTGIFDDLMQAYTTTHELVKVKTTNMGSMFRLTYRITLRDPKLEKSFIDSIRCRNGNLEITVSNQETAGSEL